MPIKTELVSQSHSVLHYGYVTAREAAEGAYLQGESVLALLGLAEVNPRRVKVAVPRRARPMLPSFMGLTQAGWQRDGHALTIGLATVSGTHHGDNQLCVEDVIDHAVVANPDATGSPLSGYFFAPCGRGSSPRSSIA